MRCAFRMYRRAKLRPFTTAFRAASESTRWRAKMFRHNTCSQAPNAGKTLRTQESLIAPISLWAVEKAATDCLLQPKSTAARLFSPWRNHKIHPLVERPVRTHPP